jgi:hypothetical protein
MRNQFQTIRFPPAVLARFRKDLALEPLPDLPSARSAASGTEPARNLRNYVSTLKIIQFSTAQISITFSDQFNPRVIAGQGYGADNPLEGSQSPKMIHDRTGRINYDWIMRANLLNHFTIGVDRYNNQTQQLSQFEGWDQKLGIQGVTWDQGAFPVVYFSGGTASPKGLGGGDFSTNANGRLTFTDTVAWTTGRHSIKFGGNYWPEYANAREGFQSSGTFTFSNLTTSQPNNARYTALGSSFASFLLGSLSSAGISEPYARGARFRSGALFVQDEWRATGRLTFSLGLRWEGNSARLTEQHGQRL